MTRQRLNTQEAAEALGISVDAVRMRTRRGTLDSEHENGRLYVWLDTDSSNVHPQGQVEALLQKKDERIEELREQVRHFREILSEERDARRRADTILAQLTHANAVLAQRLPELEAPAGERPPDTPRGAARGAFREEAPAQEGSPETREYAVTSFAGPGREEPHPVQEGTEPRSWWRRMFGG